jgi:flavin-dependent dehydrogenase
MGGLVNRLRRFTDAGGRPLVTGFHATGDAHTCTNPIYGRGCSLALVQAVALADAVAAHPTDALARAEAYEAACREQTEPWYHLSVQTDRSRQARARRDRVGESAPDDRSANAIDRLFELGSDDPVVGRAILKAVNVLATPQQLMSDPAIVARVMELAAANGDGSAVMSDNRWLRQGPTHQEMIDLTKGSTTYA